MAASLSGEFNLQEFTDLGAFAAGYRLYTYTAGTTTQKTAYTDAAGSVAHTYTSDGSGGQYIALNSRGELPAPLFLTTGAYDITLKTSAGVTVWTRRAVGMDDAQASADNVTFSTSNTYQAGSIGKWLKDLATSVGSSFIGFKRSWTGTVAGTLNDYLDRQVFDPFDAMSSAQITDVVSRAGTIDTVAFVQAAVNAAYAAGGGTVLMRSGKWRFAGTQATLGNNSRLNDGVTLYSNVTIEGEADTEIALDVAGTPCCTAFTGRLRSAVTSSANNLHDIHIRRIKFTRSAATFFQEQLTIFLDSCERFSVKECKFIGWSGDAIMLGGILNSTASAFLQSIIKDGEISGCLFDGVNNDTRQAISIFNGESVDIHDNIFKNTTRSDMPGAIDIEPELATDIVKAIKVHDNYFYNCGGFGGVIGAALTFSLTTPATAINFDDNVIVGCPNSYGLGFTGRAGASSTTMASNAPTNVSMSRNVVIGVLGLGAPVPYLVRGVDSIWLEDNKFINCRGQAYLSLASSGPVYFPTANVFTRNTYLKCKVVSADATLGLNYIAGCVKTGRFADEFIDSGNWANESTPTNMRAYSIDSAPGQDSTNLHFDGCRFNTSGTAYNSGTSPFYCSATLTSPTTFRISNTQYIGLNPDDQGTSSLYKQAAFDLRIGTATYDPPSLASGTLDTAQTITVTGVALGDHVNASFSLSLAGCRLEAYVSAANTVTYQFSNPTAGTINLGSGSVTVRVRR
jgi:hypothetical protein